MERPEAHEEGFRTCTMCELITIKKEKGLLLDECQISLLDL